MKVIRTEFLPVWKTGSYQGILTWLEKSGNRQGKSLILTCCGVLDCGTQVSNVLFPLVFLAEEWMSMPRKVRTEWVQCTAEPERVSKITPSHWWNCLISPVVSGVKQCYVVLWRFLAEVRKVRPWQWRSHSTPKGARVTIDCKLKISNLYWIPLFVKNNFLAI